MPRLLAPLLTYLRPHHPHLPLRTPHQRPLLPQRPLHRASRLQKETREVPLAVRFFGSSRAAVATISHDDIRMRRGAMNRFFSKESVRRLEPILQAKLDKLLEKLEGFKGAGRAVNVKLPFSAFTGDVIT
jgi:cytochrome P450